MKNNKMKITKLRKEIMVKDLIVKELIMIITENKIKLPEKVMQCITTLYAGEIKENGKEKK